MICINTAASTHCFLHCSFSRNAPTRVSHHAARQARGTAGMRGERPPRAKRAKEAAAKDPSQREMESFFAPPPPHKKERGGENDEDEHEAQPAQSLAFPSTPGGERSSSPEASEDLSDESINLVETFVDGQSAERARCSRPNRTTVNPTNFRLRASRPPPPQQHRPRPSPMHQR